MTTWRQGASANGTPGEASPKATTRHGCCEASIVSMISRRESTSPASSCPAPWALTWMRLAVQQLRPGGPARGEVGRERPLVGGSPARGGGADLDQAWRRTRSWRATPAQSWVRADGDATTTSAPVAPDAVGPSGSRRLVAMPCACSAAHMSGSHAMVSSPLTWPATQAAACDRTDPKSRHQRRGAHLALVRTARRSLAGGRAGEPDDSRHRGRAQDQHADRQEQQRPPRAAEARQPPRRPQADGRRQDPSPRRSRGHHPVSLAKTTTLLR